MSFFYDETQTQIGEQAARVLKAAYSAHRLRVLLEQKGDWDQSFWGLCQSQGWTGITLPEEYGGSGLGLIELGLIADACGRVAIGAPFLGTSFGLSEAILRWGTADQKSKWLPQLASGDVIGAIAFAEAGSALPPKPSLVLADGRLHGTKPAVPGAGGAQIAAVHATDVQGEVTIALVELGVARVTRTLLDTFDNSRCSADLVFDGAPAIKLATPNGLDAALHITRLQAVLTAHEQVGGAQVLLEMTRDFANQRMAFGQRIGVFQAVKHRLAEAYILIEMARANAMTAAAAAGSPGFARAAAAARISATEAYDTVARDAVQLHGGIGVTWEADLHLHLRRARTLALEHGSLLFWEDELVSNLRSASAS